MINGIGGLMGTSQMYSMQQVKNPFEHMDANGDGSLDVTELDKMAERFSAKLGQSVDASEITSKLDSDGDGLVSQDEFKNGRPKGPPPGLAGMMNGNGVQQSSSQSLFDSLLNSDSEESTEFFDSLDLNEDGVVDEQEIRIGMGSLVQQYLNQSPNVNDQEDETESLLNLMV